ncbi:hypothetical protein CTAYLR_008622 [Chrysophaeum taylorii]|uniref:Calponin-homology (CH) domain-containing protein n=1 Tax=Chrysophaeum taylorii TaxID=2483200 RepID=A0AAD7XRC7_9STRA|nr:hypothetical protein CTAYLR_008622 [Chrysophaeum taylorii]
MTNGGEPSTKAVLQALRALQAKIERLERERSHALEEATDLRLKYELAQARCEAANESLEQRWRMSAARLDEALAEATAELALERERSRERDAALEQAESRCAQLEVRVETLRGAGAIARAWINSRLRSEVISGDLVTGLRTGVVLWRLVETVKGGFPIAVKSNGRPAAPSAIEEATLSETTPRGTRAFMEATHNVQRVFDKMREMGIRAVGCAARDVVAGAAPQHALGVVWKITLRCMQDDGNAKGYSLLGWAAHEARAVEEEGEVEEDEALVNEVTGLADEEEDEEEEEDAPISIRDLDTGTVVHLTPSTLHCNSGIVGDVAAHRRTLTLWNRDNPVPTELYFDEHVGPKVAWVEGPGAELLPLEEELPFACLPENTSSIAETALSEGEVVFLIVRRGDIVLFGASVMRSARSASQRGMQQAVAVLSRFPAFDVLETRARALAVVAIESPDREAARALIASSGARCATPSTGGDFAASIESGKVVDALGAEKTVRLLRCVLKGESVALFSSSAAKASRCVVGLASLLPAVVSLGLSDYVTTEKCPLLGANSFRWRRDGFPVQLDAEWIPAAPISRCDHLLRTPTAFVVGTCNAMLARRLEAVAIVVDLDAASILTPSVLAKAPLEKPSMSLVGEVAKHKADDFDDWLGSDAWLRSRCETWVSELLGRQQQQHHAVLESYEGERKKGLRHGRGAVRYADGGYYDGEWRENKRHGEGVAVSGTTTATRRRYEGEWVDDLHHGRGRLVAADATYEGWFAKGKFHGKGELSTAKFSYRGEFSDGKFEGAGCLERAGGQGKHVGEWRAGLRRGVGHAELEDGTVRAGRWEDDLLVDGTVSLPSGETRAGRFDINGCLDGEGTLTTVDGDVYEGLFRRGEMLDDDAVVWAVRYADGRKYAGKLKDGLPSGEGVLRYEDASVYQGSFLDGLRSGKGTFVEGEITLEGEWRCDGFVGGGGGHPQEDDDDDEATVVVDLTADLVVSRPPEEDDIAARIGGENNDDDAESVVVVVPESSPLVSEETPREDEVARPPRKGCARVRYPNGDVYEGSFESGLRHGRGLFTEALSGHAYDGEWRRGKRHGRGTFATGDGTFVYDGEFVKGKRCGEGVAKLRDSCSYAGSWRDNVFDGRGILVDAAKNSYEGEFFDGRKHGVGAQTYADGARYSGEWRRGYRDGQGHCDYPDGTTYAGRWERDKYRGHGTILKDGRAAFDGSFDAGKRHGWGLESIRTPDGKIFRREGRWSRGFPDLSADDWTLTYPDNSTYVGPVSRDEDSPLKLKPHGKHGVMKWANGDTYAGGFVHGKRAGLGFAVFHNGDQYRGEWHDDHISLTGAGDLTLADGIKHKFNTKI